MKKLVLPGLLFAVALAFLFVEATVSGQTRKNRPRRVAATVAQPVVRAPQLAAPPQQATPTPSPTPSPSPSPSASPSPTQSPTPPSPAGTPPPASTTDEAAIDEDEIVRVNSNLVVVPVAVTDARGEAVQGLQAADFRLEEESRAQEVAQLGDAEQVPLDIALMIDVSSSVSERFQFEQQAAARFLKQVLKPADRAAIFAIRQEGGLEQGLTSVEVASIKLTAIPAASVPTPTAFYDSVVAAAKYLAKNAPARHRRVILVISDGEDNFSERIREAAIADYEARVKESPEQVRAAARKRQEELHRRAVADVQREVQAADAVFYSINPSGNALRLNDISTRAQNNMRQLADATGGNSFVPERLENLDTVFRQIANELRAQYLLQYYSNSNAPAGKFLNIKVGVPARAGARVRARQGYYVKK